MMRRNFRKPLTIIVGFILTFACISIFSSVDTISKAYAQEKTTTVGVDKIKTMLLRPGGWLVEWRGNSAGVSDYIFEDRGEKVVVKINTAAWNMSCERDVTITSDVVKLDGCHDTNISLFLIQTIKNIHLKVKARTSIINLKQSSCLLKSNCLGESHPQALTEPDVEISTHPPPHV